MGGYVSKQQVFKEYFDSIAGKKKTVKSYYWKSISEHCDYFIHEDDKVLEIGSGTGDLLGYAKATYKVGLDFSEKMLEASRANYPEIDFRYGTAENLDISEKFDVVVLSNIVGCLDDIQSVFNELHKVCHERTRIIVTYYNYIWEPIIKLGEILGFKKKMPIQNWLSHHDIINLLYLSGFETYKMQRRVLMPYNIPLVAFLLNKYLARLPLFNSFGLNQFIFARPSMDPESDVSQKYSTTIVIPARNESGNIENAITRLPKFGKHLEIIFIEGNSTDDTWETIQRIQEKYKDTHDIKIGQQSGKGKGDAVRKGYGMATGDILMILDADLTVPPEDLPKFYEAIARGKGEFINGARLVYPMEKEAMRFLNTLGNKFFSLAFSWLLEQPIKDSLCGTKVMFREDYVKLIGNRKFFGEFDPFGDFDLLFGAYKLNLKIIDLPIRYQERVYGDTNISRFKHGVILLRMCIYAAGKIKFW